MVKKIGGDGGDELIVDEVRVMSMLKRGRKENKIK